MQPAADFSKRLVGDFAAPELVLAPGYAGGGTIC